jgi:protein TonB
MNRTALPVFPRNILRLVLFTLVALAHGALILLLAFQVRSAPRSEEEPLRIMKLADLVEAPPLPPPPPPPPPPSRQEERVPENAVESIAENFIETDEVPKDEVVVSPGTIPAPSPVVTASSTEEVYLRPHQVSDPPKFDEADIRNALRYPPIALRSGIEGTVYLELFIDREGAVRQITVLREDPPGRGFAEAALRAFEGLRCTPAQANGQNVSVRYRYPVSFRLR